MRSHCKKILLLPALTLLSNCGSLIGELERIKSKATAAPSPATPTPPSVLYTIPADGTVSAPVQGYIDIVFDQPIDSTSATASGSSACTGTVGASYNDFMNCGGTPSVTGNVVRLASNPMPQGVTLKVRVNGVKGTNGATANAYQSATGLSFTSPCGQNCFYSESAPLTGNAGTGMNTFLVSAGANAGKHIILHGGAFTSTIYDPATNQTSIGPSVSNFPGAGSHNFQIPSGSNAGHTIIILGGNASVTNRYDTNTNGFAGGPATGANAGNGATSFLVTGGTYAGKMMTVMGNSLATTNVYDNGTNTFGAGPTVGSLVNTGAHGYRLDSGPFTGEFRLLIGGATTARHYDDASDTWILRTASNCSSTLIGLASFRVNFGAQSGKFYQICGGGAGTNLYDQNITSGAGAVLPAGANAGAVVMPFSNASSNNKTLVFGANNVSSTMLYTATTDSWSTGPFVNTAMGTGGTGYFTLQSGVNSGKHFIILGGGSARTAMFDPNTGTFHGTRTYGVFGAGALSFRIRSGIHADKVMLFSGSVTTSSTIYDPNKGEMIGGPNLMSNTGAGASVIEITSGPQSGKYLVINGNSSSSSELYNPSANTFVASGVGGAMGGLIFNGSSNVTFSYGPMAGQTIIFYGNFSTGTTMFDPVAYTFAAGIALAGCSINTGSFTFTIPADGLFAGQQFVVCGGSSTGRLDPAGPSFTLGSALPAAASAGAGAQAIFLKSGVHAGKFLIFHGGAVTTTTLFTPSSHTMAAGPSMVPCGGLSAGAQVFPIQGGSNKGKFMILLGGGNSSNCMYDPATNAFSNTVTLGPHSSYGANDGTLAFPAGNGLYPTAQVIVHGGLFSVFSHYFAY